MKRFTPASVTRALVLLCLVDLSTLALRAEKLVTVLSTVEAPYARRRATPASAAKPETYVFAKGRQPRGATDASLAKTDFSTIVATLAADLPGSRFEPAAQVENADLVLTVHWGVTKERGDDSAMLQYDPEALRQAADAVVKAEEAESADISMATRAMGAKAAAEAAYKSELQIANSLFTDDGIQSASNADLLGFRAAMSGESDLAETLRSMAGESRYFIILVAYDGPMLRTGQKRRLWISRMSIRAAGVNFPIALGRMSSVGGALHGTPQVGIVLRDGKDRPAPVKSPTVKILAEPPSPSAPPR